MITDDYKMIKFPEEKHLSMNTQGFRTMLFSSSKLKLHCVCWNALHLIYIFNERLRTQTITSQMKFADISPLFRKFVPLIVINYRLVSVTKRIS